jgi:Leucine-rich repeat (LRR) protein
LKKHTKSHRTLLEYLSESIEPPKNLQLLNFSRHIKESLFILEKIRNKKNCTFSGKKYAKFFHPTFLVPSRLPQQVICHLPKSQLRQDESLINNLHFKKKFTKIGQLVQKLQQLMPFFI